MASGDFMKDYVCKALAYNDKVRIYAASSTNLVEEARKTFGLWPTSCAALGRTLTAAAIISTNYKSNENLTVRFDGDGPLGEMLVEASNGYVRGFVSNAGVFMQYDNGHLAVGKAVGQGTMTIIKDLGLKEPFTTTINIQTGEIGDDFTYYFAASEQTPSAVGLGVLVETDNSCKAAGGFILQLMPGCDDETITKIENTLKNIKPVSEMVNDGLTPEEIIKLLSSDEPYEILDKQDIFYKCPCNKDQYYRGIKSLGKKELQSIIDEIGSAEVTCNFCRKTYKFKRPELEEMIKEIDNKE